MCAIVDANVAHQVFGNEQPEAGMRFLQWLESGRGLLVVGGRLYAELLQSSEEFRLWAPEALRMGKMIRENASEVNELERQIFDNGLCSSDDPHVLALAQISGARLLYSNDSALQDDFTNHTLINNPRGKIYSTRVNRNFVRSHRDLLNRRDLCSV